MNDDEFDYELDNEKVKGKPKTNLGQILIVVILIIVLLALIYLTFIKEDDTLFSKESSQIQEDNSKPKVEENFEKLTFVDYASSETGDMYLDDKGMVYFRLSDEVRKINSPLLKLEKEYYTESNDIYSENKIKAIIMNIVDVESVKYSTDEGETAKGQEIIASHFIFKTKNNRKYYFIDGGLIVDAQNYVSDAIVLSEIIDIIDPSKVIN